MDSNTGTRPHPCDSMTDEPSDSAQDSVSTCPTCGRPFETVHGMRVHHSNVHGDPLPNRTCRGCGEPFYDLRSERRYCPDCPPHKGENNPNWRGGKTKGTCIECGAEFEYYPSEKPGRYCPECVADDSITCTPPQDHWGEGSTNVSCEHCESSISVYRSKAEGQDTFFCDRDCYAQWLSEIRREHGKWRESDNPNWSNGVIADEVYGEGWFSARRAALLRDNYTCTRCGITREELDKNPDVHHIKPARTFDDRKDAHALDNLICLCRSCHIDVERDVTPEKDSVSEKNSPD